MLLNGESVPLSTEELANLEQSMRRGKRPRVADPLIEESLDGLSLVSEEMPKVGVKDALPTDANKSKPLYHDRLTNAAVIGMDGKIGMML